MATTWYNVACNASAMKIIRYSFFVTFLNLDWSGFGSLDWRSVFPNALWLILWLRCSSSVFYLLCTYLTVCKIVLFFKKSIALHDIGRSLVDCSFVPRILKNHMFWYNFFFPFSSINLLDFNAMMPTQLYRTLYQFLGLSYMCPSSPFCLMLRCAYKKEAIYSNILFLFFHGRLDSPSIPIKPFSIRGLQKYLVYALRLLGMMLQMSRHKPFILQNVWKTSSEICTLTIFIMSQNGETNVFYASRNLVCSFDR